MSNVCCLHINILGNVEAMNRKIDMNHLSEIWERVTSRSGIKPPSSSHIG